VTAILRRWLWAVGIALTGIAIWMLASGARRSAFFALLVPPIFALFAYGRVRLYRQAAAGFGRRGQVVLLVAGMLCDAIMVAQLVTARGATASWLNGTLIAWLGPVWFSAHGLALLGYGGLGLLRMPLRPWRWWRGRPAPAPEPAADEVTDAVAGIDRRTFLRQAGAFGAVAPFAVSLSGVPLSYDFRVEERTLRIPGLPPELDGLRVAHLSDIHVGGAMDRDRLLRVAALTNAARPDLVVHTGDFLTHRNGDFDAPLYEALAAIGAPHGQWACLGNHDFDDPERFTARLREAGVTALRDRLVTLPINGAALEVGGLDFTFGRDERAAQIARRLARWSARGTTPRLLLNHDPSSFAALPDGCADLVLSGHTHGGHIGVQLGRDTALTVVGLAGLPDQGVFTRGAMQMYVTRCVGFYGYPMRVGIPPEIALLVLRA
jgi:predicted MPP superfamily phosphohydrolase